MGTTSRRAAPRDFSVDGPTVAPVVEVAVPVYNEAGGVEAQIHLLDETLRSVLPMRWQITIVDNGSTDGTAVIADRLATELPHVEALHLPDKGRGRALREVWTHSRAEVVAYTDVDLSTDLRALFPLVGSVLSGHAAIAVGSRLAPGARTTRGLKREFISRAYNALLHLALGTRVRDAQCGFKAMGADLARALLPEVDDQSWFFDTELLVRAERHGLRILEVPVDWVDDPDFAGRHRPHRGRRPPWCGTPPPGAWPSPEDRTSLDAADLGGRRTFGGGMSVASPLLTRFRSDGLPRRVVRCMSVSVLTTAISLVTLAVLATWFAVTAWVANVAATALGTVVSYRLNRSWVWHRSDASDVWREVLPFWALSFAGLILSTLFVAAADDWATAAHLAAAFTPASCSSPASPATRRCGSPSSPSWSGCCSPSSPAASPSPSPGRIRRSHRCDPH